jgi:uncharacterized protein (DUF58 family)
MNMNGPKRLTVFAAAGAIILVAWIVNVSQLYWMAGVMLLLPRLSRAYSQREHRGIDVQRRVPQAGHQGDTVLVRLRVRNHQPVPKLQIGVQDQLPRGLTATNPEPVSVRLSPRGEDTAEYSLRLARRGVHTIPATNLVSEDFLGLYTSQTRLPVESRILVYPRVIDLPGWSLPRERGGGPVPLEAAQRSGEGSTFFGIREYRPGDPLRHVHWRTAARWNRMAVIEWEADESADVLLAVDTEATHQGRAGDVGTLDLAAALAASVARHLLVAGDSVRLLVPGAAEWQHTSEQGVERLSRMLEVLARMEEGTASLSSALRDVTQRLAPGTAILLLAPSPAGSWSELVRFLRGGGFPVTLYALSGAAAEWEPLAAEAESLECSVVPLFRDPDLIRLLVR